MHWTWSIIDSVELTHLAPLSSSSASRLYPSPFPASASLDTSAAGQRHHLGRPLQQPETETTADKQRHQAAQHRSKLGTLDS